MVDYAETLADLRVPPGNRGSKPSEETERDSIASASMTSGGYVLSGERAARTTSRSWTIIEKGQHDAHQNVTRRDFA